MRALIQKDFDNLIPVQIIGTQRSGSNLFRLMINQLKDVFAPHPPHILRTFSPIVKYYGDLRSQNNFLELVGDICDFVRVNPVPWKDSILDPEIIVYYCRENTLLEAYRKVYEINAINHGARYWFNKSMQNVYYIEQFEATGFMPFFIHLVRDGRDVSLSFKNAIVGDKHIYHLAQKWKKDQDISDQYFNKYSGGKAIRVRYEDLITHPQEEIKNVCQFLGMKYSDDIFKYYESEESHLTADSGKMWRNLVFPIIKDNFNKYRSGLTVDEIRIFEKIARDLLRQYGYELNNHFDPASMTFNHDEIDAFSRINTELKQKSLENADLEDLKKREGQRKLLDDIYRKRSIPGHHNVL